MTCCFHGGLLSSWRLESVDCGFPPLFITAKNCVEPSFVLFAVVPVAVVVISMPPESLLFCLSLLDSVSSSNWSELSAADGMVGRKRTLRRPGGDIDPDKSRCASSWFTACCRTSRGFGPGIDCRVMPE